MKTTFLFILFGVFCLVVGQVQAQRLRNNPVLLERLSEAKLLEIKKQLALTDEVMKQLRPVYKSYEAELNTLNFARQGQLMRVSPDSLSAQDADRLISEQLDNAVKISTIRQKYYPDFKAVLTPQQVIKLYQSEVKIRRRVMAELRKRFGNRALN